MAKPSDDSYGALATSDGLELFWRGRVPEQPRAVLAFVHGLGEHTGRYDNPFNAFVPRDYACYVVDLRGHGESDGGRIHVDDFDEYHRDVNALLKLIRERHPELPIFLVGHSMGGLVTLRYVLAHPERVRGTVVSGPGLGTHPKLEPSAFIKVAARLMNRFRPHQLFDANVDPALVSRDSEVVKIYRVDPKVGRKVSARWYASILQAMDDANARANDLQRPTLVMYGTADQLVDPAAIQRWADAAPAEHVESVAWDGLYHEIFNEPEKDQVFERMAAWLDQHLAG